MVNFDIPKDWIPKALETLKEISEIISLIRQTGENFERIEREVQETKKMINDIKLRSKALIDRIPKGWIKTD